MKKCPKCGKDIPFKILTKNGYRRKKAIKCFGCSSEFLWDMKRWILWTVSMTPALIFIFMALFIKEIREDDFLRTTFVWTGGIWSLLFLVLRIKYTKLIEV